MERPVLVLGAEPRVAVTIARSLHRHGIPVWVAACSGEVLPSSRAVKQAIRLPSPRHDPDAFGTALHEAVRREGFDTILPTNDTTLAGLADQFGRLQKRFLADLTHSVYLGCPAPAIARRVLDKSTTLAAARRCGIAVPFTVEMSHAVELDRLLDALRFPAIVKPRSHVRATTKIRYVQTREELRRVLERDPALAAAALIQEYCPGVGVGIEMLMHEGEPLALFQHRRLKELPASGGVSVLSIAEPLDTDLVSQAVTLLRELQWNGVAMVEFRYDRRRRQAALMEVNGRYWGSLALSVQAGLDFPYYEWQLAHGQRPSVPERYRTGIRCRWTRGLLLRTQEGIRGRRIGRWGGVLETLEDVGPSSRDALWSIDDPGPALQELGRTLYGIVWDSARGGLKRLVPPTLRDLLRAYRSLGPRDGRIYLCRNLHRLLGLHCDSREALPPSITSVLFVCHGNILRSPMAATLLEQALTPSGRRLKIMSAGLHAKPYGRADERGCTVAMELGCSLETHESQMVSKQLVDAADIIFVMDRCNEAKLLGRFPQASSKVRLLAACEPRPVLLDITDPYDGDVDDVRQCYQRLARCVTGLATLLGGGGNASVLSDKSDAEKDTVQTPNDHALETPRGR